MEPIVKPIPTATPPTEAPRVKGIAASDAKATAIPAAFAFFFRLDLLTISSAICPTTMIVFSFASKAALSSASVFTVRMILFCFKFLSEYVYPKRNAGAECAAIWARHRRITARSGRCRIDKNVHGEHLLAFWAFVVRHTYFLITSKSDIFSALAFLREMPNMRWKASSTAWPPLTVTGFCHILDKYDKFPPIMQTHRNSNAGTEDTYLAALVFTFFPSLFQV